MRLITMRDSFKGMKADSKGSVVSVSRMNAGNAYVGVPDLLKKVIDEGDEAAWGEIKQRIDYINSNLDEMLLALNRETRFVDKIRTELGKGKILLVKPNLVNPQNIDAVNHGQAAGHTACTEWPLVAALMRWLHDSLDTTYGRMALGEAASVSSMTAGMYNHHYKPRPRITTEAVFEGRSGDFYGGWGFYFVRRYLSEASRHAGDDPMLGYEESISGRYLPPGRSEGRMMVYDLNKLNDIKGKTRTVPVAGGVNYREITMPKILVGGNPGDKKDQHDYPGAVLINVPRLKVHAIDLLTNAIKNLGIGLYPMEIGETEDVKDTHWKYSFPYREIPGMKTEIPHAVWVPDFDEETGLPLRGGDGGYKLKKTGGIAGTQADVIRATLDQGVYMLHVVDAIQSVNVNHTGDPSAREIPEGLVLASEDPVALDQLCARYCFKNVPRAEAEEQGSSGFLQKVPIPRADSGRIITGVGYDSPLERYHLYEYTEKRGLGRRLYHVVGWDEVGKRQLSSVDGHLGSFTESGFTEIMTGELYHDPTNLLWGLQKTAFSYLKANDELTGSSSYMDIIRAYDENGDGRLDYDEMGRDAFWHTYLRLAAYCYHLRGSSPLGWLKSGFLLGAMWRYADPNWNLGGHDFMKNFKVATDFSLAYSLSKSAKTSGDPTKPGMSWGEGTWPTLPCVGNRSTMSTIYGYAYPGKVSLGSLVGYAFQYADKKHNSGDYTGVTESRSNPQSMDSYLADVRNGSRPLGFTVYVPVGFGKMGEVRLPNVEETSDPGKVFTAAFPDETWEI